MEQGNALLQPLNFPGYEKKVMAAREKSRLNEAIVTGKCKVDGNPAVVGVCDRPFHYEQAVGHVVVGKIHRRSRARHQGKTAGYPLCLLRRSQDAGGHCIPDADGQDLGCLKAPS